MSKDEVNNQCGYIAPCEEVCVESPSMTMRTIRTQRPSNELCKRCLIKEYCNEFRLMIGENYKPACYVDEDNTCIIDEDNL